MASRRKKNGATSIKHIEDAAKRKGWTIEAFFLEALKDQNEWLSKQRPKLPLECDGDLAQMQERATILAASLAAFKARGPAQSPVFAIPDYMLVFASNILDTDGRAYGRERKFHRPSIAIQR